MKPQIPLLLVAAIIIIFGCVGHVYAIPTTQAATLIGNNNVTLNSIGSVGDMWFQYGTDPTILNYWSDTRSTPGAVTVIGGPIYPSTTYYFQACDSSGCGSVLSFTTTAITPLSIDPMGTAVTNMTKSNFNMLNMPQNLVVPYSWLFPTDTAAMSLTIVFGMLMMFIYIGMWLRTRSVATGVIMGILTSSFILFTNQGLNLGIPVEFANIAQGILYASLAAILLTFLKK